MSRGQAPLKSDPDIGRRAIRTITLALALTVGLCSVASAQPRAARNACSDDAIKLCPNVEPGKGGVVACLVENKDKITPACTKLLVDRGALK